MSEIVKIKQNDIVQLAKEKLQNELNIHSEFIKQKESLKISFPHQLRGKMYLDWLSHYNQQEADMASAQLGSLRGGNYSVLPLVCQGLSKCPHAHVCPFSYKVPIGLQCPMEQAIIVERMEALMNEFGVDGHRASEFMMLNRVIELELLDMRTSSMLASPKYQSIMRHVVTGATPDGELIENEEITPLLEIKEKVSREKMKILSTLVATPEAKYKKQAALKEKSEDGYSKRVADISRKLAKIEQQLITGD